jgi:hypothetical protein
MSFEKICAKVIQSAAFSALISVFGGTGRVGVAAFTRYSLQILPQMLWGAGFPLLSGPG